MKKIMRIITDDDAAVVTMVMVTVIEMMMNMIIHVILTLFGLGGVPAPILTFEKFLDIYVIPTKCRHFY